MQYVFKSFYNPDPSKCTFAKLHLLKPAGLNATQHSKLFSTGAAGELRQPERLLEDLVLLNVVLQSKRIHSSEP